MKSFTPAARTPAITKREAANRLLAREAAAEGIVLLKNEDNALPLAPGKLALFGAGASHTVKGGTGSGEVNERQAVTILEGLKEAGFEITTEKWIEDFIKEADDPNAKKAKRKLDMADMLAAPPMPFGRRIEDSDIDHESEAAIYVVSRQAGEGGDRKLERGDFDLDDLEADNIRVMAAVYKKSILVINSGSYLSLSKISDVPLSAILFVCQMGMEGGNAFADVLTGKVTPSGKLTDTWAKVYEDVPCHEFYSYLSGDVKNQYYKEGIYVGYRYYDTFGVEPLYPFGFGLSYTTFEITRHAFYLDTEKQGIRGTATVKNTGNVPGKEVVQVYVTAPEGELPKEYQRLTAFAKTKELQPGEEETLELFFPFSSLASYSEAEAAFILEKGDYIVRIGTSSRDTKASVVMRLNDKAYISRHQNLCSPLQPVEEITPVTRPVTDDTITLPVLSLSAADVVTESMEYEDPLPYSDIRVDNIMARLTLNDMIDVCVGGGISSMMSADKFFTPGAVGRTTTKLYKKGLINVNLADGPAGLRLLRVSALNKKGKLKFVKGNSMISVMDNMPGLITKLFTGDEETSELLYQYATAWPVGTTLAQTWDTGIMQRVGEGISLEMSEYGITYWLGPAMNIHKNPLCGRNFEYMSEDPYLTGKMAAALVKGVQTIDGNYATVKHFCCNNAEDDRMHSNSRVNERALREIYLKGFEMAVKEGGVKSVMSSYNYDLLTGILRNEWGFTGVVMTDWFSTLPGQGSAGQALHAGNDMIMAGLPMDKMDIKKALKNGQLSKLDIRRCAANIVRQIVYSHVAKKVKAEMFE